MTTNLGWVILGLVALILLTVQVRQNPADQSGPGKAGSGESKKPDLPDQWTEKVKVSTGIDPRWPGLISLGELVKKDIGELEASFSKNPHLKDFIGLLAIQRAVVSGFDYELKSAGDSFGFWKAVRTPGSEAGTEGRVGLRQHCLRAAPQAGGSSPPSASSPTCGPSP